MTNSDRDCLTYSQCDKSTQKRYILCLAEIMLKKGMTKHAFFAGVARVPFGKYEGDLVFTVPITYLAETVVDMRPSVFVLVVRSIFNDPFFIQNCAAYSHEFTQRYAYIEFLEDLLLKPERQELMRLLTAEFENE